jgi:hypothetical protein
VAELTPRGQTPTLAAPRGFLGFGHEDDRRWVVIVIVVVHAAALPLAPVDKLGPIRRIHARHQNEQFCTEMGSPRKKKAPVLALTFFRFWLSLFLCSGSGSFSFFFLSEAAKVQPFAASGGKKWKRARAGTGKKREPEPKKSESQNRKIVRARTGAGFSFRWLPIPDLAHKVH